MKNIALQYFAHISIFAIAFMTSVRINGAAGAISKKREVARTAATGAKRAVDAMLQGWQNLDPELTNTIQILAVQGATIGAMIGAYKASGGQLDKPLLQLINDSTGLTTQGLFSALNYQAGKRTAARLKADLNPFGVGGYVDLDKLGQLSTYIANNPSIEPFIVNTWGLNDPQIDALIAQVKNIRNAKRLIFE